MINQIRSYFIIIIVALMNPLTQTSALMNVPTTSMIAEKEPFRYRYLKPYRNGRWRKGHIHAPSKERGAVVSVIATYAFPKHTSHISTNTQSVQNGQGNTEGHQGQHDVLEFWNPFLFSRNRFTHKEDRPWISPTTQKIGVPENNSRRQSLSGSQDLVSSKSIFRGNFQNFLERFSDEDFFKGFYSDSGDRAINKQESYFDLTGTQGKAPNLSSASSQPAITVSRHEINHHRKIPVDDTNDTKTRKSPKNISIPDFGKLVNVGHKPSQDHVNSASGYTSNDDHRNKTGQSDTPFKKIVPEETEEKAHERESITSDPKVDSSDTSMINRDVHNLGDINGKDNAKNNKTVERLHGGGVTRQNKGVGVDKGDKSDDKTHYRMINVKNVHQRHKAPQLDNIATKSLSNRHVAKNRVRYIRDVSLRKHPEKGLAPAGIMGNKPSNEKTPMEPKNDSSKIPDQDKDIAGVIVLFKDGTLKKSDLTKTMDRKHKLDEKNEDVKKTSKDDKTLPKVGVPAIMHPIPKDRKGQANRNPSETAIKDKKGHARVLDGPVVIWNKNGKHDVRSSASRPSKKVVAGIIGVGIFLSFAVLIGCTIARIRNEEPNPRRVNSRTALYENHRFY